MEILVLKNKTEMKNSLERLNSTFQQHKKRISVLEDRFIEIIQSEEQKKIMKKNDQSLRDLWDIIQHTNLCIMGGLEGEEREKRRRKDI